MKTLAPNARGIQSGGVNALNKRLLNAFLIGFPFCGTLFSAFYFCSHRVESVAVVQLFAWYLVTGIGVGIGFHRLFSHKSFQTFHFVRICFGFLGSLACQGSVIRWIADHRRHHRFSDQPPDTHSPHYYSPLGGKLTLIKNLWHAHVGWMFDPTTTDPEVYAPDLMRDPVALGLHKWYLAITACSFLIPYLIGWLFGGREAAFQSFLLGGCVRTTLLHNLIWAVNSIGHTWGGQPSSTRDGSRNNKFLAVLTFGEGWHNNHHAAPRSAYNNWRRGEIDLNGAIIRLLARTRVVWNVKNRPASVNDPKGEVLR